MKIFILFFLFTTSSLFAQDSVIDDLSPNSDSQSFSLITEIIVKISNNRKIFIISASNNDFNEGDFISLISNNELVCRAIVAKIKNQNAGIKIIKLYSSASFNNLKINNTVQIIRGDDSFFKNKKVNSSSKSTSKFNDEDDLFSEDIIEEENSTTINDKKGSLITTDHIIAANFTISTRVPANLLGVTYSYQVTENVWGEILYNQAVAKNWPQPDIDIDTIFKNFIVRLKYTFKAPAYSFLQPYLGLSIMDAKTTSPNETKANNDAQALVDSTNIQSFVAGVTLLKRLVPGWFIRGNIGLAGYGIGIALEF